MVMFDYEVIRTGQVGRPDLERRSQGTCQEARKLTKPDQSVLNIKYLNQNIQTQNRLDGYWVL